MSTAIITQKRGEAKIVEAPIPKLRDDYILVEVKAVALNPTDWKHLDYLVEGGEKIGCDYSGIVYEIGSAVTKDLKKGDRVAGFAHGGNTVYHEDGAFGTIITAKGDVAMKIPDNISFEEAATLGVGITTVGQALYQSLGLPLPEKAKADEGKTILIYGASTATGGLAIQYARLSGFKVLATCSPHNFNYVKSLGAAEAFDYNSPTVIEDIKAYTKDSLAYVFDCISESNSTKISVSSMASSGGIYSTLLPVDVKHVHSFNSKVENKATLGYTIFGERFIIRGNEVPAKPEDFEFGKMFWDLSTDLLAEGKVKVHTPAVNKFGSGFEGIMKGLDELRHSRVSGEKLVFTL